MLLAFLLQVVWHRLLGGGRSYAWHPPGSVYPSHPGASGVCAAGWSLRLCLSSTFIVTITPLILSSPFACWYPDCAILLFSLFRGYTHGLEIRRKSAFKSVWCVPFSLLIVSVPVYGCRYGYVCVSVHGNQRIAPGAPSRAVHTSVTWGWLAREPGMLLPPLALHWDFRQVLCWLFLYGAGCLSYRTVVLPI